MDVPSEAETKQDVDRANISLTRHVSV